MEEIGSDDDARVSDLGAIFVEFLGERLTEIIREDLVISLPVSLCNGEIYRNTL